LVTVTCISCATTPPPSPPLPEEPRPHDSRVFTVPAIGSTFAPMAPTPTDAVNMASSSRWAGTSLLRR
jgi:hypothetical protein